MRLFSLVTIIADSALFFNVMLGAVLGGNGLTLEVNFIFPHTHVLFSIYSVI